MKKTIAFFDFDGTITRKDSMLELIRYAKGDVHYFTGLIRLSPWLIAMKAGLLKNEKVKEKMLALYFKNIPLSEFNETCLAFSQKVLPSFVRKYALKAIAFHKEKGHEIVVVTASAENWVKPWCEMNSIKIIATQLETDMDLLITGKLRGLNCNGDEKVNRIKSAYNLSDFEEIYCYGDSAGDKPMLEIATHSFYRHFKD